MESPEVSLIVPVYKVPERFLRKCIESCMHQTIKAIEIVIVHDAANDNCGDICDEYAEKDSRITVIHKQGKTNSGLSAARNTGVENATGNWIMFVDGDDFIEPDMCERMLQASTSCESPELVLCGVMKTYGNNDEPYKYSEFADHEVFDEKGCMVLQERLLNFDSWIACAYAKLISREYLISNNIFHDPELKQGVEGLEFNVRMFEHLTHAVFIKQWLYHYVYNDESLSVNLSERTNQLLVLGFNKINNDISTSKNKDKLESGLMNRIHYAIVSTAIRGYFNPNNKMSNAERRFGFEKFASEPIIKKSLSTPHTGELSASRKIVLFCLQHKIYWAVNAIARVRMKQLSRK